MYDANTVAAIGAVGAKVLRGDDGSERVEVAVDSPCGDKMAVAAGRCRRAAAGTLSWGRSDAQAPGARSTVSRRVARAIAHPSSAAADAMYVSTRGTGPNSTRMSDAKTPSAGPTVDGPWSRSPGPTGGADRRCRPRRHRSHSRRVDSAGAAAFPCLLSGRYTYGRR
jgi:hypothetical protein